MSDNSGAPQPRGYEFTITNGQVTAVDWVVGTHSIPLPIPSDASFTVGTNSVTETITGTNATDVLQFTADAVNTGLYDLTSESTTITSPSTTDSHGNTFGYSFTITSGTVTQIQETIGHGSHTFTISQPAPPDATFTTGTGTVTETTVAGNAVTTTDYVQPSGSTLYAVESISTTFIQQGTAQTALSVNPYDRAEFTIGSGGTVTQVQTVSPSGTVTTITPNSHTTYTQLATGFVEETVTYGSHSSYTVYAEGTGGIYTDVAHGSGTTVDLVGLKAQLAELPAGLEALV